MPAAVAPGKIILSGEHSVVYGAPALAMAVRRHIRIDLVPGTLSGISWRNPAGRLLTHDPASLTALSRRLDAAHEAFLQGERAVETIITRPEQLLFYALAHAGPGDVPLSGELVISSSLPLGAGMGSSAALVAAALLLCRQTPDLNLDGRIKLAHQVRHCERLQHGRGSLIDAATVCCGGRVRLCAQTITPIAAAGPDAGTGLGEGWFWINTGSPEVSTGVCVEAVRAGFATDQPLWDAFAGITDALIQAADADQRCRLVRENHRLLQRIGVVPDCVAQCVAQIEALGGAGKISGAGSIRGDAGGLLLAWLPSGDPDQLALPSHWRWGILEEEVEGARFIRD